MSNEVDHKNKDSIMDFIAGLDTVTDVIFEIRKLSPHTNLKYILSREELEFLLAKFMLEKLND